MSQTIEKSFSLHPSILYSIINEQAGDPVKALTELVMNSMDAGATEINFIISANEFSISDNGVGFKSLEEIESFFGTFGTPHQQNDAKFGKFRLGRGQIFSLASTEWRSDLYGMTVDLAGKSKRDILGYELLQFEDFQDGCFIKGEFYTPLNVHEGIQNAGLFNDQIANFLSEYSEGKTPFSSLIFKEDFMSRFIRAIGIAESKISINGVLITNVENLKIYRETENAKFYLSKTLKNFNVHFNKGIYISHENSYAPLIVDFKVSPNLNLARNQVNSDCPVYKQVLADAFNLGFEAYMNNEKWAQNIVNQFLDGVDAYIQAPSGKNDPYLNPKNFLSHLNANNIEKFLNRLTIKIYKDGEIKNHNFIDALELIKSNPTEYVFNDLYQNEAIKRSSLATLKNALQSNEFAQSLVIDEFSLMGKSTLHHSLNYFFKRHFSQYEMKFEVSNHDIFNTIDDLNDFRVSKKVAPKKELEKVKAVISSSQVLDEATTHFVDQGILIHSSIPEFPKKLDVLSGYFNHIKKLFKDHFESDGVELPKAWLISSNAPIKIITGVSIKQLSGHYDGIDYILIDHVMLIKNNWAINLLISLFNNIGATSGLLDFHQAGVLKSSVLNTLNELVYEHDDIHHKLHNSLDDFLEKNSLYDLLKNAEFELNYLSKSEKMLVSQRNRMKAIMSLIDMVGSETPELTTLMKPELEMMEKIYIQ